MKLIDLKIPKEKKTELDKCVPSASEVDAYPYGMRLDFGTREVAKDASLKEFKVGDKVMVSGIGVVTEVRMSETQAANPQHSICVQLHKVGCELTKSPEKMSMKEYIDYRTKPKKD